MSIFDKETETQNNDNNGMLVSSYQKYFTDDVLEELNQTALSFEEIFNNRVTHALYQEELTQHTLLYKIAENLYLNITKGYILNLSDKEFIKNVILLFEYGKGSFYKKLLEKLPAPLKVILKYHTSEDVNIHFWFEALMSQISIKDLMNAFNLQPSADGNIQKDRLTLEPYCIALDAALQQYDFDTGKHTKSNIFTSLLQTKAVFLELRHSRLPCMKNTELFLNAFPYRYRFLIDAVLTIDFGCFLNGLIILTNMVFGGPSERFLDNVTKEIIRSHSYTIPFSNKDVFLPIVSTFPLPKSVFFYTPFFLNNKKTYLI